MDNYTGAERASISAGEGEWTAIEHPKLNHFMIAPSLGVNVSIGIARSFTLNVVGTESIKPAYEAAARHYLDKTGRAHCVIVSGNLVDHPIFEFVFTCKSSKAVKEPFTPYTRPVDEWRPQPQ